MTEEIRDRLEGWAKLNNNHPCDDQRLYDIALLTASDKIGYDEYVAVVGEGKYGASYSRYEDVQQFARYLKDNEKLQS